MVVIAGNAFPDTHEEIVAARELGVPVIRYHQFLGEFLQKFTSIAVTGAHGKTSTTGLLAHVMQGAQPTSYLIGDGSGKGREGSKYFVFEACEYRRHFLAYSPDYAIMTNIDFDHPDYFANIEDVFSAFQQMAWQVKKELSPVGMMNIYKNPSESSCCFYGFGEDNDFQARNIVKHRKVHRLMCLCAIRFSLLFIFHDMAIITCLMRLLSLRFAIMKELM